MKNFSKILLATSAMALISSQGLAAFVNGTATATILTPISIAQTTGLSFGTFAPQDLVTGGTVTSAGVGTNAFITSAGTDASFTVTGNGTASFSIALEDTVGAVANRVTIDDVGAGAAMTATLTGGGTSALVGGTKAVPVSGTLTFAANPVAGVYNGTYKVTVLYN